MTELAQDLNAPLPDVLVETERVRVQGHKHALIASKSEPGHWHSVSFEEPNEATGRDEWCCTCKGFECRKACRHVRALDRWNAGLSVVEGLLLEVEAHDPGSIYGNS